MKSKNILALVTIIVIFALGVIILNNPEPSNEDTSNSSSSSLKSQSKYTEFSQSKLASTEAENIILFFKADWCPTCRTLERNILDNPESIPEDTIFFTVDYDTETELKQQYKVATQHTIVRIDQEGNQLDKWVGLPTLQSILNLL